MGVAQDRGRAGETLAAAYLELMGCRLVARNVRLGGVEVDLVVDDGPSRELVEVRLRSRGDYGGAAETLGPAKRDRLRRAASVLEQQAVIGGDGRCLSIAAASVLAKVVRDRIMERLDQVWPAYGFAKHKGYGTAEHMDAIREHGPCPLHRWTFAPVSALELPLV